LKRYFGDTLAIASSLYWGAILHLDRALRPRWLNKFILRRRRSLFLASSTPAPARRLLVDVSIISKHDAGTGIQRVVRKTLTNMLAKPGISTIQPIQMRTTGIFATSWPSSAEGSSKSLRVGQGDVFLGLDFSLDPVLRHSSTLAQWKQQGIPIWFIVYDLLPIQRPSWFSSKMVVRYRRWLNIVAALADGFLCISSKVAEDLKGELYKRYSLNEGFAIHVLPMGWDLEDTHQVAFSNNNSSLSIKSDNFILTVGTIEPRKGHAHLLKSAEIIWNREINIELVLVGKPGWGTSALQRQIKSHPEFGRRLHWLQNVSDDDLEFLYHKCRGVIAASFDEGFGLPLIEALGRQRNVLARDIPIFRLHDQPRVSYFPAEANPTELADFIENWLEAQTHQTIDDVEVPLPRWTDTAEAILAKLMEDPSRATHEQSYGNFHLG
jgi:glycosyltransferase involved in cell wall biosynthesis